MQLYRVALAGAFVFAIPDTAVAAPQPLRILTGQVIKACAKRTTPPRRDAMLCTQSIRVSGGAPIAGGYRFRVKTGTQLPAGVLLMSETGVITARREAPPLPASGRPIMQVTVSDGTRSAHGSVALQMDTSAACTCPDLTAGFGDLPAARAGQPYGLALPVSGPNPEETLRPTFIWTAASVIGGPAVPPGMTLDKTTGVLRGIPDALTRGHSFVFNVTIKEKNSNSTAVSPGPFILCVQPSDNC